MRWDPKSPDFDPHCPELRLFALWTRLTHNLLAVQNLLSVTQFGAVITRAARTPEGFSRLSEFCHTIDLEPLHIDANGPGNLDTVTSALADNASRGVEAAALVFTHSMAEELLMDLCRILAEVDRAPWEQKVENRKVTLHDLRERGQEEMSRELVEGYLTELSKESIVKKADALLSVLQPDDIGSIIPGLQFDRESLEEVDTLRHECAHREIKKEIPDLQGNIALLENVVRLFIKLAEQKHNLRLMDLLQDESTVPSKAAPSASSDVR